MDADGVRQVGDGLRWKEFSGLGPVGLYLFDGEPGDSLLFRLQGGLTQQGAEAPAQAGITGSFRHNAPLYLYPFTGHVSRETSALSIISSASR